MSSLSRAGSAATFRRRERVATSASFTRSSATGGRRPAERAGIRPDDVLLRVGDYAIIEARAGDVLALLQPGESVTMQIVRGAQKINVKLVARRAR